jgi:hypothetical protein
VDAVAGEQPGHGVGQGLLPDAHGFGFLFLRKDRWRVTWPDLVTDVAVSV